MAPRGIRNNNPGNIEYGKFARSLGAYKSDGRFAKFRTPEQGIAALTALQQKYESKYGLTTVRERIARWAPAHENNVDAYANAVARAMGISPDTPFSMSDPVLGQKFIAGMIQHENGRQPYNTTQIIDGYGAAISGAATEANIPNPRPRPDYPQPPAPPQFAYADTPPDVFKDIMGLGPGTLNTGQTLLAPPERPPVTLPGNIDLNNRQVVKNPDGSISTEESMSFSDGPGREVLIPTVFDGKHHSADEAIQHYYKTGEHLGIFPSPQAADAAAMAIHNRQDRFYNGTTKDDFVPRPAPPAPVSLPDPMADRGTGLDRAIDNRAAQILTARNPALPGALGSGPGNNLGLPTALGGGSPNIHAFGQDDITGQRGAADVGGPGLGPMPYTAGMGVAPPMDVSPPAAMSAPLPGLDRSGIRMASLPGITPGYIGAPPTKDAYNVLPTNVPTAPNQIAGFSEQLFGSSPATAMPTPAVLGPLAKGDNLGSFPGPHREQNDTLNGFNYSRPPLTMPVGLPSAMPRFVEDELYRPGAPMQLSTGPKEIPAGDMNAPQEAAAAPVPPSPNNTQRARPGGILGAIFGGGGLFGRGGFGVFQPRTSTGRFANGSQTRFVTGATATPFQNTSRYGTSSPSYAYNYATGTTPNPYMPH